MEERFAQMEREIKRLRLYSLFLILLVVSAGLFAFSKSGMEKFKEITVERINVVEENGQLRMVISNKSRSQQNLFYGKPLNPPIPGGTRPGIIFFNDEGTENGGLVFTGSTDSSGQYSAFGHLSFDQYNSNQVLYLSYQDINGQQKTGLHIDDWQTSPYWPDWRAAYKNAQKLPDSPEKEALLHKLMVPEEGRKAVAERIFVGKDNSKTAMVTLADRMGQARLQMLVDSNGNAKLNFLDAQGKITYSLPNR
ncbi:hypothetical protein SAMN05518672_103544 [Chitinophaga sp. CF118]|uniref:hypothetical protein n=1 Tax=Chitinophaga sp. CF118 TaxID=1884367 RepID=UPI0008E70346|nr:hypothetical protein [Chitinophaga sp. CF118]SFD85752.1 hypothetical protein SAMN05518672_103544 [Chitinophaga sp. CF118]